MDVTRETILRGALATARHNLCCYTANFSRTAPKDGCEKEFQRETETVKVLEAWLKEFQQVHTAKIKAGRHINGITLNCCEWLLEEEEGGIMYFDSEEQAKEFLLDHGETEEGLERYKFETEETAE